MSESGASAPRPRVLPAVPAASSRVGLAALNFFIAATQTGFGAFLVVYLAQRGWSQTAIGTTLSIGVGASLLAQLPGGALVDALHAKRTTTAGALLLIAVSALVLAAWPARLPVWLAQVLHAAASAVLTPAIAAVTLALCGHAWFSEQLGANSRWASLGSAAAAVLLGGASTYLPTRWTFVLTAALVVPALLALPAIHVHESTPDDDEHCALLHPRQRRAQRKRPWHVFFELHLHVFAVCVVLFQFADAGLLPLALGELTRRTGGPGFVVTAAIVVPQMIVAAISPAVGRAAQRIGRRPLLLIGFAVLPVRGLLFASLPQALPLVLIQSLDGISGAVMGIMVPLIAADLTRRSGYLNLAIGSLGLAASLGALPSTLVAGWVADHFGARIAFLMLTAVAAVGFGLIAALMAETRPHLAPVSGRTVGSKA